MNLNRRVPNGLPGGVRGRKFYYFLLLDYKKSCGLSDVKITFCLTAFSFFYYEW